jgi:predicted RNA-binding Zn ribbon-like protein
MDNFRTGYGSVWLDLLATQKGRRGGDQFEYLPDASAARRWLRSVGFEPTRAPDDGEFARLVELREALYAIARAVVAENTRPPAVAVRLLNASLADDVGQRLRATASGLAATRPADATAAIGRIARQAAEQLTGPERARLRPCGDDGCGGIFLDESGRRRWCADATCGSRSRVRAHRARSRTQ